MDLETKIFLALFINAFAFIMYGVDKGKARSSKFRIPESSLLLMAFAGGAFGAYAGMKVFHHKVNKTKFSLGVPLAIIVNIALYVWLFLFRA